MARNLLDLANSLERKAGRIEKAASTLAKNVAQSIVGNLANVTPVDTSKALSNWQVGLIDAPDSSIEPFFPGQKGSSKRSSANATIKAAKRILGGKKPGEVIYISNVLPYIARLNDGYSNQTPAGFVERAVLIGRKEVKKSKLKV